MKDYFLYVRHKWAVLIFGFLAVFWGNFGQSFFVGFFGEGIQESLGLSATVYGIAYSSATMASAATVVWLGGLIDRLPLRVFTAFVCCGLALAGFLMWQANSLILLILGYYCLRLFGQALFPHTGSTTIARVFDTHRGKALSIAISAVPAGEVILPPLAAVLIIWLGWQDIFFTIGVIMVVVVLPLMLWLIRYSGIDAAETAMKDQGGAGVPPGARRALLSDYRYWLALPGLMAGPFVVTGIFMHQNFVTDSKDWTPAWWGTCFTVYGVVHWMSSLTAGTLVDRFRPYRLLPFFPLPMVMALAAVSFLSGQWLAILFMALLAMTIGSAPPISGALWPEIYGTKTIGAIRSLNIAVMVFATSLSPVLYGFCIDQGVTLPWLMGLSSVYVLISAGLLCFSYFANPRRHPIADQ